MAWQDQYGNTHDLDFVIERDGSDEAIGQPLAFIEVAWRRYTKHSRNKAQEIQGAILPLAEKYNWNSLFLGTVLAGVFTEGSLEQLKSHGFHVLYFPYETLVAAFEAEAIDIRFDEGTPDEAFRACADRIESAPPEVVTSIKKRLIEANQGPIDDFFAALNHRLTRSIVRVLMIPLYGRVNQFATIGDALRFLDQHAIYEGSGDFGSTRFRSSSRMVTKCKAPSIPSTERESFWSWCRNSNCTYQDTLLLLAQCRTPRSLSCDLQE